MDRMIYLAMNGAQQSLRAQAVVTNNLANATTIGFRADFEAQRAMPVFGDGMASRVYSMTERPGVDFRKGAIQSTGNELHVAIQGEGFIAVQDRNGQEAYTRAGDLHVGPGGLLMNGAGRTVIGNGGPMVVPPGQSFFIGGDGTLSIRPTGQAPNALAIVDRVKLVNPPLSDILKGEDGLFRTKSGQLALVDANVQLSTGSIEASNVNSVGEMVRMIELQRHYELQIKAMHTADQNESAMTETMRFG